MNLTKEIIGFSKKEIGYKILISVFMRVTVLILPILNFSLMDLTYEIK